MNKGLSETEGGDWTVIETGDAQFSGVSQVPLLALWGGLAGRESEPAR